jgi:hypothetical protein
MPFLIDNDIWHFLDQAFVAAHELSVMLPSLLLCRTNLRLFSLRRARLGMKWSDPGHTPSRETTSLERVSVYA